MKKLIALALVLLALPLVAAQPDAIFVRYEAARQALLHDSLPALKAAAKELAIVANNAQQPKLAAVAANVQKAADLKAARAAFGALSDETIRYRASVSGSKPVVVYCDMHKQSWLQPAGEIGNPYADAGMRTCGEITSK